MGAEQIERAKRMAMCHADLRDAPSGAFRKRRSRKGFVGDQRAQKGALDERNDLGCRQRRTDDEAEAESGTDHSKGFGTIFERSCRYVRKCRGNVEVVMPEMERPRKSHGATRSAIRM